MPSTVVRYQSFINLIVSIMMCTFTPVKAEVLKDMPSASSQGNGSKSKKDMKKDQEGDSGKKDIGESSDIPENETFVDEEANDPLEPLNRLVFAVNEILDYTIIRPAAEIYRAILPEPVRNGVTNVLDNLYSPIVFLNNILQGEPEQASVTVFRFLLNSSFGIGGLVDVASDMGYPRYDTDFNHTLTAWGVDTGPYIVLPLIGSSSIRGTVGIVGDYYSDPLNLYLNNRAHRKYRYWLTVRYGAYMISQREKHIEILDNLRESSPDMYVTLRSIYFQRQAYMAEQLKTNKPRESTQKEDKEKKS
ncbi:MAG: VacJ family lipoprotein [Alphaproteobacteria bacterium]|nr:VacJ family lipoprotein [Alphaproteobacteria bacterium]